MTAAFSLFGIGLAILALMQFFSLSTQAFGALTLAAAAVSLGMAFGRWRYRPRMLNALGIFLLALGMAELITRKPVWAYGLTFVFAVGYLAARTRHTPRDAEERTVEDKTRLENSLRRYGSPPRTPEQFQQR